MRHTLLQRCARLKHKAAFPQKLSVAASAQSPFQVLQFCELTECKMPYDFFNSTILSFAVGIGKRGRPALEVELGVPAQSQSERLSS
jgi:hypothetical protein